MNGQYPRLLPQAVRWFFRRPACGASVDRSRTDMKFILLHEARNDEGIRAFFTDVWELYTKVSLVSRRSGSIIVMSFCLADNVKPISHGTYVNTKSSV